ncbi:Putative NADPH-quinone reductase (modulator of drug activity B) [Glycomyces sambucus]|uniref:Putative NADPH-quinone reductase (Modulator of drug activity B) n=1 Tax=Glycomyces sambucus TaxID=380244 RepID=A0A1G9HV38_9ACTN|nr:NAD(P)H oxidoreductase [Glycomyces sambucus]SDL16811.1 Putative NADPH-quinone reductase (modulator of drug activity B) [Glycomyces sambucus]
MSETEPTALVVIGHHRSDSLTAAVAERAAKRLAAGGYRVDVLHLEEEAFDPRGNTADEPDYGNRDKRYSEEVHRHFARVRAADVIVPVFPVWWYGLPALLKGWIDRVWNYGLTYGRSRSPMAGKRMLWIALAGLAEDDPNSRLTRDFLDGPLRVGISEYCGIPDAATVALYDSEGQGLTGSERDRHYRELFARADAAVDGLL